MDGEDRGSLSGHRPLANDPHAPRVLRFPEGYRPAGRGIERGWQSPTKPALLSHAVGNDGRIPDQFLHDPPAGEESGDAPKQAIDAPGRLSSEPVGLREISSLPSLRWEFKIATPPAE